MTVTLLKLGGSLITDKNRAHTARPELIRRLAGEIREALDAEPFPLIIGHGSGSFGHIPAKKYGTRNEVRTGAEWAGFAEVHSEATALNRIFIDILRETGLPVLSFVPMDCVRSSDGKVDRWDTDVITDSITRGLIPVIFGDTVFDSVRGGTILSTEDLFLHLCTVLPEPPRILLAGLESGVWKDYPKNTELIDTIRACSGDTEAYIRGSEFTDVTGGMQEKVHLMKTLIAGGQAASAVIFSGMQPGNVKDALTGSRTGTRIIP